MIQDIIKYRLDYSLLAAASAAYIVAFLKYQYNPSLLLVLTIIFGVVYILWGIFHHLRAKNLHPKIVLEYLLVSFFAVLLVATLLI